MDVAITVVMVHVGVAAHVRRVLVLVLVLERCGWRFIFTTVSAHRAPPFSD